MLEIPVTSSHSSQHLQNRNPNGVRHRSLGLSRDLWRNHSQVQPSQPYATYYLVHHYWLYRGRHRQHDHAHPPRIRNDHTLGNYRVDRRWDNRPPLFQTSGRFLISSGWSDLIDHRGNYRAVHRRQDGINRKVISTSAQKNPRTSSVRKLIHSAYVRVRFRQPGSQRFSFRSTGAFATRRVSTLSAARLNSTLAGPVLISSRTCNNPQPSPR